MDAALHLRPVTSERRWGGMGGWEGGKRGKYPGHKILKLPREFSSEPGKAENMDRLAA